MKKGTKNLTTISNNVGVDGFVLELFARQRTDPQTHSEPTSAKINCSKRCAQGNGRAGVESSRDISERIAQVVPVFRLLHPDWLRKTVIGEGKEVANSTAVLTSWSVRFRADFAFVKAWKGDKWGNLVYRKTARNFNPMMATAAKVTIAEVEDVGGSRRA